MHSHDLHTALTCQTQQISLLESLLQQQGAIILRLLSMGMETIAIKAEIKSLYARAQNAPIDYILDDTGEWDDELSQSITTAMVSLTNLAQLKTDIPKSHLSFKPILKALVALIYQQQRATIDYLDRLRLFIREHDVDAEPPYPESFATVEDLMQHLNS